MADFVGFVSDMVRGDTHQIRFVVKQMGVVQNLSTWQKFWFSAKLAPTDADGAAIVAVTSTGGGITLVDAANGLLQVNLAPAATAALLEAEYDLYADLQGKDASGNIWTLAKGMLKVSPDVTQTVA